ncbi:hypothetical protein [Acidisoma silvae]|uniref:Uncharacterized protein n=1 Tax=Acidisoma silvae TaxID=2802396 RepID=A0A963YVG2_9PROT|nr:hypothetical protein [Acidisoma silvae]MCB8877601.1 hypothetical protein [Acidisoma silvae]
MSGTINRAAQVTHCRTLVERATRQVEALLRQTDADDANGFALPLMMHLIAEILVDKHGDDGIGVFLSAAHFAAGQISKSDRLTEPKVEAPIE